MHIQRKVQLFFFIDASKKCLEKTIDIISDAFYHSLFHEKNFMNEKKVVVKEIKEKKLRFKIPKKKQSVAGVTTTKNIKIYKYYSKKDFGLAKKTE